MFDAPARRQTSPHGRRDAERMTPRWAVRAWWRDNYDRVGRVTLVTAEPEPID